MEDKVVIQGEFKGSRIHFRNEKNEKTKIDCVGLILKKIKRVKKLIK